MPESQLAALLGGSGAANAAPTLAYTAPPSDTASGGRKRPQSQLSNLLYGPKISDLNPDLERLYNQKVAVFAQGKRTLDDSGQQKLAQLDMHLQDILYSDAPNDVKEKSIRDALRVGGKPNLLVRGLQALDTPGAYIRSGLKELVYDPIYNLRHDGGQHTSWGDFKSQADRHASSAELFQLGGRGPSINIPDAIPLFGDRLGVGGTLGFIEDVASDPLTYLTGPAGTLEQTGKKGVAEVFLKAGAEGKIERELADRLAAKTLQRGVSALTDEELRLVGGRAGLSWRVPGTGRVLRPITGLEPKYIHLPGTEYLTRPLGQAVRGVGGLGGQTAVGRILGDAILGGRDPALRRMILEGGSTDEILRGYYLKQSLTRYTSRAAHLDREWNNTLHGLIKDLRGNDFVDLRRALEDPTAAVAQNVADAAVRTRQFLDEKLAETNAARATLGLPEVPKLENYFPHRLTADYKEYLAAKAGRGQAFASEQFNQFRTKRIGETWLGVPLEKGTIEEMEQIATKVAVEEGLPADTFLKVFKGDARDVLPFYLNELSRQSARIEQALFLKSKGLLAEDIAERFVAGVGEQARLARRQAIKDRIFNLRSEHARTRALGAEAAAWADDLERQARAPRAGVLGERLSSEEQRSLLDLAAMHRRRAERLFNVGSKLEKIEKISAEQAATVIRQEIDDLTEKLAKYEGAKATLANIKRDYSAAVVGAQQSIDVVDEALTIADQLGAHADELARKIEATRTRLASVSASAVVDPHAQPLIDFVDKLRAFKQQLDNLKAQGAGSAPIAVPPELVGPLGKTVIPSTGSSKIAAIFREKDLDGLYARAKATAAANPAVDTSKLEAKLASLEAEHADTLSAIDNFNDVAEEARSFSVSAEKLANELDSRYTAALQALDDFQPTVDPTRIAALQDMKSKLIDVESKLDKLRQQHGGGYSSYGQLERQIAYIEQRIKLMTNEVLPNPFASVSGGAPTSFWHGGAGVNVEAQLAGLQPELFNDRQWRFLMERDGTPLNMYGGVWHAADNPGVSAGFADGAAHEIAEIEIHATPAQVRSYGSLYGTETPFTHPVNPSDVGLLDLRGPLDAIVGRGALRWKGQGIGSGLHSTEMVAAGIRSGVVDVTHWPASVVEVAARGGREEFAFAVGLWSVERQAPKYVDRVLAELQLAGRSIDELTADELFAVARARSPLADSVTAHGMTMIKSGMRDFPDAAVHLNSGTLHLSAKAHLEEMVAEGHTVIAYINPTDVGQAKFNATAGTWEAAGNAPSVWSYGLFLPETFSVKQVSHSAQFTDEALAKIAGPSAALSAKPSTVDLFNLAEQKREAFARLTREGADTYERAVAALQDQRNGLLDSIQGLDASISHDADWFPRAQQRLAILENALLDPAVQGESRRIFERAAEHQSEALYYETLASRPPPSDLLPEVSAVDWEKVQTATRVRARAEQILADTSLEREASRLERVITRLGPDEMVLTRQFRSMLDEALHSGFFDATKLPGTNLFGHADTIDALTRVEKVMTPEGMKGFLKVWDGFTGWWKAWATTSPGFVFRNGFGGVFNNYAAGMDFVSYVEFGKAWKAFLSGDERAIARLSPTELARVRAIYDSGIAEFGQSAAEVTRKLYASKAQKILPGSQNVLPQGVRTVNQGMENMLRGSLAWDTLKKGGSLDAAIDNVVKFHFDYGDLSRFERNIAKRVVPFWTFTARNLPLQLQILTSNPGAFAKYLHFTRAVASGSDVVVPGYFAESNGVRIGETGGNGIYLIPDLPFVSAGEQIDKVLSGEPSRLLEEANPLIKVPYELSAKRSVFSGAPITSNLKPAPHAWTAIPGLFPVLGLLGKAQKDTAGNWLIKDSDAYLLEQSWPIFARTRRQFPSESRFDQRLTTTWLSFVFGVGLRTNTPNEKLNELFRRDEALVATYKNLVARGVIADDRSTRSSRGR